MDSDRAAAWRTAFERDGFVIVPGVLSSEECAATAAALDRIEARVADDTLPGHLRRHVSLERDRTSGTRQGTVESAAISNIMELPLFDPLFQGLIVHDRTLDVVQALFGTGEFAFHNLKCISKMPGAGAAFQWHRDLPYLAHTGPNLLTCMLCVDGMTVENGATVLCPGSHRIDPASVTAADTDLPDEQVPSLRVHAVCPPGSAVVFHVNVVHGGGPNLSLAKRRNVISIWSGPDTYPITPWRYAYQGVMPRSADPGRQGQIRQTFPD
jgi:ectoine hydroxylase-related dioxygenase (phytanoyl-CoA dioxygenase family)